MRNLRIVFPLLLGLGLLCGCGSGLSVNLVAEPDPAAPGQTVKWTLSVRNNTACATADVQDPPPPFPADLPLAALIIGFNPQLSGTGAQEFCRDLQIATTCPDGGCLQPILSGALGPETTGTIMAAVQARATGQAQAAVVGMCQTLQNDSSGFVGLCELDPLGSGLTETAMFMDTAPDTGVREAAQVALAFALATGPDCKPGTEIAPGVWLLAGCFPLPPTSRVPVLSPIALAGSASILFAIGAVALYRRRKA